MLRHKRETKIFHVLTGPYRFEVDRQHTTASAGETVVGPLGSTHRFINIDKETSRMLVLITPGLDAAAFFLELLSVVARAGSSSTVGTCVRSIRKT